MNENKRIFHIAIDGPVASGKGTVAKALSERLGIPCLDTGAMYRAFAVYAAANNVNEKNEQAVLDVLEKFDLSVRVADKTYVSVDGVDVTDKIRTNEISMKASILSSYPAVRENMVAEQRNIAKTQSFILEGRDIASVVLPDAKYKFYLTADLKCRALRRQAELKSKGINIKLDEMIRQIRERDENDKNKPVGALVCVPDAILIDNTKLGSKQTLEKFLSYIC